MPSKELPNPFIWLVFETVKYGLISKHESSDVVAAFTTPGKAGDCAAALQKNAPKNVTYTTIPVATDLKPFVG